MADRQPGGILGRLARDRRGNTLAMMAIALIPLVGMAGSAVDTARVYYVKVRLQQACDAGVLAGRKTMDGTDFNTNAYQQAQAFFGNNFKTGMLGSQTPTFVPVKTTENQVAGTASVVVPMTLTKLMGMTPVTLSVACEAKLEIPNLDVMFVLDTTGSMADPDQTGNQTKISGLRTAVLNFYDTVEASKKVGTRVRYGFVPYSSNVNVGMLLKPEWMVDSGKYQSRVAMGTRTKPGTTDNNEWTTSATQWKEVSGKYTQSTSQGSAESCKSPPNKNYTNSSDNPPFIDNGDGTWTRVVTNRQNGTSYSWTLLNNVCTITETIYSDFRRQRTETRKKNPNYGKTSGDSTYYDWRYKEVVFDVSNFKGTGPTMAGGSFSAKIGNNHTMRTVSWNASNACIEERQTVKQTNYNPYPTNAYDLDVDMVPIVGNSETQWKPWIPSVIYLRPNTENPTPAEVDYAYDLTVASSNTGLSPCPSAAVKLSVQSKATFTKYMNDLKVGGSTHHDIGFLWGTRLLSPTGIFAAENASTPGGGDISRHLIFMTDGKTDTFRNVYEAYGVSAMDQRRTNGMPTDADQNTIVANRLSALCAVAKRKNITVWVIAFGTSLSPLLTDCASDGRSFEANNAAQLNQTFSNIAAQIAKLRVAR